MFISGSVWLGVSFIFINKITTVFGYLNREKDLSSPCNHVFLPVEKGMGCWASSGILQSKLVEAKSWSCHSSAILVTTLGTYSGQTSTEIIFCLKSFCATMATSRGGCSNVNK